MNSKQRTTSITPRLVSVAEACDYVSCGQTYGRKWFKDINAIVRFGRSIKVDLRIVDTAVDAMRQKE